MTVEEWKAYYKLIAAIEEVTGSLRRVSEELSAMRKEIDSLKIQMRRSDQLR